MIVVLQLEKAILKIFWIMRIIKFLPEKIPEVSESHCEKPVAKILQFLY